MLGRARVTSGTLKDVDEEHPFGVCGCFSRPKVVIIFNTNGFI